MFGSLGLPEILIVGAIAILLFGPRQLPKMGKAIGDTIRELKNAGKEITGSVDQAIREEPRRGGLTESEFADLQRRYPGLTREKVEAALARDQGEKA